MSKPHSDPEQAPQRSDGLERGDGLERKRPSARIIAAAIAALALVALIALAPGGSSDNPDGEDFSSGDYRLNIVAYAVPKPGFDAIIPAFRDTEAGQDVGFAESYGASGDQSRKVVRRVPADVVNFSVEPDITRLVKAGVVDEQWREGIPGDTSGKAVPFGSVVSFVTRKGNPKNLRTWDDLLRDGVEVISPNPASSGSAKWNILAPYAYWFFQHLDGQRGTKDYVAAHEFATGKIRQLVGTSFKVRPKSGREATSAFEQGQGDALLSYENEAIMLDRTSEGGYDYLNPPVTFRIENPVAVVNTTDNPQQAQDFRDFLFTEEAQEIWASEGFRPGSDLFTAPAGEQGAIIDSLPAAERERFRPVDQVHSIDELAEAFAALAEQSPQLAEKYQLLEEGQPKSGWKIVDSFLFNRAQPGDGAADGVISTIYKEA
ncbi:extracellular solute-binding protein [Corynebacterium urogenitale]